MARVIGILNGKKYISPKFKTEAQALAHGYKLTYRKDGNTKRVRGLKNWRIV